MTQNRPASPQSCISNINPVVSAKIENMIQKIEYAETIFGGTNKVKRIIVEEIISRRQERRLSHEQMDGLFRQNADWPRMLEIEENPTLLTYNFLRESMWLLFGNLSALKIWGYTDLATGKAISDRVREYLIENPEVVELAMAEFQQYHKILHITNYSPSPDKYIENMLQRMRLIQRPDKPDIIVGQIRSGHINQFTPLQYACIHIDIEIMRSLNVITEK